MPAVSLPGWFSLQMFTDAGAPAAGYRLYTFAPNTTTNKLAYTEQTGTTAHTYTTGGDGLPYIALNSRGELPAPLFLQAGGYDIVLKDAAGVTEWTRRAFAIDDQSQSVASFAAELLSPTAAGDGDSLVGWSAIYDIRDGVLTRHASLAAAVSAIGSTRCTVVVRDDVAMAANATLPSTATLRVENRAQITTTGYTLTINGPFLCDPMAQCFAGSGTVTFGVGSVSTVEAKWFPTFQAAVTAAQVVGDVHIPFGTHDIAATAGADSYSNGVLVPFAGTINADPSQTMVIRGDGGKTRLRCTANNMILLRVSRNNVTVRDICLDSNGYTGVILCGIVPESMTQTTTQVSQSFINLENVDMVGGASVDGIVIQPGPRVSGSDSGCFYHNIIGGMWNFVGGGRHVFLKKGATWATDSNRPTRTNFIGCRAVRGNVGYYFEVGSEIQLIGCNEELIANGTTPLATPTARWVSADAANINFFGGYSEACSQNFDGAANNVSSWGYIPSGGASVADWRTYANSWADGIADDESWTPVVASSGGGAEGASTSTGRYTKHGKIVHFTAQVSVAKGTLGAGNISVTGLPFIADSAWTGADFQGIPVTKMDGITLGTNNVALVAYISGATLSMRKMHGAGAGMSNLTVADCSATIIFTVQGWYKAV